MDKDEMVLPSRPSSLVRLCRLCHDARGKGVLPEGCRPPLGGDDPARCHLCGHAPIRAPVLGTCLCRGAVCTGDAPQVLQTDPAPAHPRLQGAGLHACLRRCRAAWHLCPVAGYHVGISAYGPCTRTVAAHHPQHLAVVSGRSGGIPAHVVDSAGTHMEAPCAKRCGGRAPSAYILPGTCTRGLQRVPAPACAGYPHVQPSVHVVIVQLQGRTSGLNPINNKNEP